MCYQYKFNEVQVKIDLKHNYNCEVSFLLGKNGQLPAIKHSDMMCQVWLGDAMSFRGKGCEFLS